MAKATAESVFSSPAASAVGGVILGPGIVGQPPGGLLGAAIGSAVSGKGPLGEVLDMENPFAAAQREDAKIKQDALEAAKNLQVTTEQSGSTTTKGGTVESSQTTFAPAGKTEQQLRDASIANFQQQQNLVNQFESGIGARAGVEQQARDTLGGVLGGDAFDLTGSEQARIDRLRDANIDVGSSAVNDLLNERLGQLQSDAARRGVRGQAFSQLQTGALSEAAKSLERQTLDANRIAAEQALTMPGQRVGVQAQSAGQFADFSDLAQQQAIANRQQLQDPVALQQALDERLRGGKTVSSSNTNQTVSTTGKSTETGGSAGAILEGIAGAPGEKAAKVAGVFGTVGALGEIGGAVGKIAGGA